MDATVTAPALRELTPHFLLNGGVEGVGRTLLSSWPMGPQFVHGKQFHVLSCIPAQGQALRAPFIKTKTGSPCLCGTRSLVGETATLLINRANTCKVPGMTHTDMLVGMVSPTRTAFLQAEARAVKVRGGGPALREAACGALGSARPTWSSLTPPDPAVIISGVQMGEWELRQVRVCPRSPSSPGTEPTFQPGAMSHYPLRPPFGS